VEEKGIDPFTSRMQTEHSTIVATPPFHTISQHYKKLNDFILYIVYNETPPPFHFRSHRQFPPSSSQAGHNQAQGGKHEWPLRSNQTPIEAFHGEGKCYQF